MFFLRCQEGNYEFLIAIFSFAYCSDWGFFLLDLIVSADTIIQAQTKNCIDIGAGQDIPVDGGWQNICFVDKNAPKISFIEGGNINM